MCCVLSLFCLWFSFHHLPSLFLSIFLDVCGTDRRGLVSRSHWGIGMEQVKRQCTEVMDSQRSFCLSAIHYYHQWDSLPFDLWVKRAFSSFTQDAWWIFNTGYFSSQKSWRTMDKSVLVCMMDILTNRLILTLISKRCSNLGEKV